MIDTEFRGRWTLAPAPRPAPRTSSRLFDASDLAAPLDTVRLLTLSAVLCRPASRLSLQPLAFSSDSEPYVCAMSAPGPQPQVEADHSGKLNAASLQGVVAIQSDIDDPTTAASSHTSRHSPKSPAPDMSHARAMALSLRRNMRARELQAERFADEIVDIADDGRNDFMLRATERGEEFVAVDREHLASGRKLESARVSGSWNASCPTNTAPSHGSW
jgi:hypothetical protein